MHGNRFRPHALSPLFTISSKGPAMTRTADVLPGITPGTWTIDPAHSEVTFSVRHLAISKVKGSFETFDATAVVGETLEDSSVEASIEIAKRQHGPGSARRAPAHERPLRGRRVPHHDVPLHGNPPAGRQRADRRRPHPARRDASPSPSPESSAASRSTATARRRPAAKRPPRSIAPTSASTGTRPSRPAASPSATRSRSPWSCSSRSSSDRYDTNERPSLVLN